MLDLWRGEGLPEVCGVGVVGRSGVRYGDPFHAAADLMAAYVRWGQGDEDGTRG